MANQLNELASENDFVKARNKLCYSAPDTFPIPRTMAQEEVDTTCFALGKDDVPRRPQGPSNELYAGLTTLQRNALAHFLQRWDFTPGDIAQHDYVKISRLPKIGKKGIVAIQRWLGCHGYQLKGSPDGEHEHHHRGEVKLDKAVKLLQKKGYEINPPKK